MTPLHPDFEAIANRMRYRARLGVFSGNGSLHEREYLKKCRARIGTTTLVFTRDAGHHSLGWLPHPTHERCWHLSIACRDPRERDTWLRAFFGENVEHLWAMAASMELVCHVWHWRLFCDARGDTLVDVDASGLLAAKMLRPRDLGVELRPRALAA